MKKIKSYQEFILNEGILDKVRRVLPGGKDFHEKQLLVLDIINSLDLGPGVEITKEGTNHKHTFSIDDFDELGSEELFAQKNHLGFGIYNGIFLFAGGFVIMKDEIKFYVNSPHELPNDIEYLDDLVYFLKEKIDPNIISKSKRPEGNSISSEFSQVVHELAVLGFQVLEPNSWYLFKKTAPKQEIIQAITALIHIYMVLWNVLKINKAKINISSPTQKNKYKILTDLIQKNIKYPDKTDTKNIIISLASRRLKDIVDSSTKDYSTRTTMATGVVGTPQEIETKKLPSDNTVDIIVNDLVELDECGLDIEISKLIEDFDFRHKIISKIGEKYPELYKKLKAEAPEEDSWKVDVNKDLGDLGF